MDAERERQIAQAAEQLAHAVYSFLSSCTAAATSLNQALVAAQAGRRPLLVPWICCAGCSRDMNTMPVGVSTTLVLAAVCESYSSRVFLDARWQCAPLAVLPG